MKESQLKALIKKTSGQTSQRKAKPRQSFDPTIDATRTEDDKTAGAQDLFREMKRRDF